MSSNLPPGLSESDPYFNEPEFYLIDCDGETFEFGDTVEYLIDRDDSTGEVHGIELGGIDFDGVKIQSWPTYLTISDNHTWGKLTFDCSEVTEYDGEVAFKFDELRKA
jgi:hypothetical protein